MGDKAQDYRENIAKGVFRKRSRTVQFRESLASEDNRLKILQFDSENSALGRVNITRVNYLMTLHSFAEFLKDKEFREVSKEDIVNYINYLKTKERKGGNGLKDGSVYAMVARIKKFYKWLNGGKEYPSCISWVEGNTKDFHPISADEILNEEEITKLTDAADNWRDKAIVECLYESGCRIGEFLGMRIKDFAWDKFGVRVEVTGKTGKRVIRLVNSLPYLKEWLKIHPNRDSGESYVWVNFSKNQKWKNPDKKGYGSQLNYIGVFQILRRLKINSGINKRVNPHMFRHSRLTHLASKIPESFLRKVAGWTADSTMPKIYVHLGEKDVDELVLKNIYGYQIEGLEEMEEKLLPKTCWGCGEKNPRDVDFCMSCHFPLDENALKARELQLLSMMSPDIIEKLIDRRVEQLLVARTKG